MRTLLCRSSLINYQTLVQESVQADLTSKIKQVSQPLPVFPRFLVHHLSGFEHVGGRESLAVSATNVSMVCDQLELAYENQMYILWQSLNQIGVGVPVSINW